MGIKETVQNLSEKKLVTCSQEQRAAEEELKDRLAKSFLDSTLASSFIALSPQKLAEQPRCHQ